MIERFIASLELFWVSYATGWLAALTLALVGVFVVARGQAFIGAAAAQASTLGVAVALWLGALAGAAAHTHATAAPVKVDTAPRESADPARAKADADLDEFMRIERIGPPARKVVDLTEPDVIPPPPQPTPAQVVLASDIFQSVLAVIGAVLAVLATLRAGRGGAAGREAAAAWVFLFGGGMAVLLLTHSPHGMEEVQRLLASSLIGARTTDLAIFAALAVVGGVIAATRAGPLVLLAMDPQAAKVCGLRTGLWSALVYGWLGLCLGLAIAATGALYTFGCLVLPALVARQLCREVRPMLWVAPLVALLCAMAGAMLANYYDYPPAQVTVALAALVLGPAWVWRQVRRRQSPAIS